LKEEISKERKDKKLCNVLEAESWYGVIKDLPSDEMIDYAVKHGAIRKRRDLMVA
jgi:hypothetical protein